MSDDTAYFWNKIKGKLRYAPIIDHRVELGPLPHRESFELRAALDLREQVVRLMTETFGIDSAVLDGVVRTANEVQAKIEQQERYRRAPPTAPLPERPICCDEPMMPSDFGSFYRCRRCVREMSQYAWLNNNQTPAIPPTKKWKPTVPHPLMQDETTLERGVDFS